ncbi:MAG: histidine kinase [Streptosporangiaceae bacterium]
MARDLGRRFLPGARTWDRHQVVDALVAGVVGVAAEVEALVEAHGQPGLLAQAAPSGFVLGGLLLFRRKRPLLAMTLFTVVAIVSTTVQTLVLPAGERSPTQVVPIFAILVLSYSLGAFGSRRDLFLGLPQPLVAVVVNDLLQPTGNPIPGAVAFFAVFLVGAPALGGRLIRGRQRLLEALAEQRRQLDIQRALQTRTALATERLRLAGRLHEDLVAGLDSLRTEIDLAERAGENLGAGSVAAIETQARTLLAQTRNVVVSLASESAGSATAVSNSAPTPGADPVGPAPTPGADPVGPAPTPGVDPVGQPVTTRHRTASSTAITWTALAAAAVCTGLLLQVRARSDVHVPMPVALLGCLVIAAPLALAWTRPLIMTVALWSAAALFSAFVTPIGTMFAAISLAFLPPFMVAYFGSRRSAVAGLAACGLGGLLCFGGWNGFVRGYTFVLVLAAWIAGRMLSARSRMVEELRSNNELLAGQREASLRQAVAEERARIARDLHDSIGHHLTIIALQAGAARRMWTSDPPKAKTALATVARVAAHGSAELRIGFDSGLLAGDAPLGTAPLTDITAMVDNARAAGLPVSMHVEGNQPDLPDDIELALFRVLQEALTNVLRHAPGAAADVTFRTAGSHVELVVANSAGDQSSTWVGGGSHGQLGMRQRAEEYGGRLDYGHRPDGGFEVRAWFPWPEKT